MYPSTIESTNGDMKMKTSTSIGNCVVTIEDGACHIESGVYSASLASLEYTGCLDGNFGDATKRIARTTINKIVEWSAANGGPADVG